jgi:hypothetical protein
MNTVNIIESFWHDLRYGARVLVNNKMFAAVAILSLALGIGANTAIFQLIDAVQFRTLPVRAPEELVEIQTTFNTWGHTEGDKPEATYAMWDRLRQDTEPFSGMLAWGTSRFDLSSSGESHFVNGLWVSGDFFNVLGVPPEAGRVFTARRHAWLRHDAVDRARARAARAADARDHDGRAGSQPGISGELHDHRRRHPEVVRPRAHDGDHLGILRWACGADRDDRPLRRRVIHGWRGGRMRSASAWRSARADATCWH